MSFWELVVIGVVALVVLGPEKLPGAIRSVSSFIAGIKQFGHQMKAELSDELRAHELHQKLQEAEAKGLLGLTSEELTALAELRQAAADVTNPYATPVLPAASHADVSTADLPQPNFNAVANTHASPAPAPASLPAPQLVAKPNLVTSDSPAQDANEPKSSS